MTLFVVIHDLEGMSVVGNLDISFFEDYLRSSYREKRKQESDEFISRGKRLQIRKEKEKVDSQHECKT